MYLLIYYISPTHSGTFQHIASGVPATRLTTTGGIPQVYEL